MKVSFKKTFYWSLGGHLGLLVSLVLFSLISSCTRKTKVPPHVFTVHSAPPVAEAPQVAPTPKTTPVVKKTPPKETPPPKKVTPKPKKVTPKPKVTPKKTPPKKVSYQDFAKEHKIEPTPQKKIVPLQPSKPKTDPFKDIRNELDMMIRNAPNHTRNSSDSDVKALHSYVNSLRSKLNLLWDQPSNLPPGEWVAHIEFSVSSTGKITNVKFVRRSGHQVFDQSLIRAMNQFKQASAPPDRRGHTFEIPFRMVVR